MAAKQRATGYEDAYLAVSQRRGDIFTISEKDWDDIHIRFAPKPDDEETQAKHLAVCAKCPWNKDNVCEHFGCLPCKQRKNGGLPWMVAQIGAKCPDKRW